MPKSSEAKRLKASLCEEEQDIQEDDDDSLAQEKRAKMNDDRRKVAQELLDTEITYVESLETLKKVFYEPFYENSKIKTSGRVISADDVRTIFGSLNIILPINKLLLGELTTRINVPPQEQIIIGDAFEKLVFCLRSYTSFINDYDNTRKLLANLKTNQEFNRFYEKIHQDNKTLIGSKTLNDFMILPVQRIPRYKMLLSELLKKTWDTHPDYHKLREAIQNISIVAQSVEDSQERLFNINKIIAIQKLLKMNKKMEKEIGKLLQPHREFFKEGVVKLNETSGNQDASQETHSRKLLLFNDILILTKIVLEKDKEDKKKRIENLQVKRLYEFINCKQVLKSSSVESQPSLTLEFGDNMYVHMFITVQKERDEWYDAIERSVHFVKSLNPERRNSMTGNPATAAKLSAIAANSAAGGRNKWGTLKRKKSGLPSPAVLPEEQHYANPLFGMKGKNTSLGPRRGTMNGQINTLIAAEEAVKKSPSMNTINPNVKANLSIDRTWSSGGDNTVASPADATLEKRKQFSRSSSVDSFAKVTTDRAKCSKNLTNLQFD